jgi:gliding motility-associated-like protein
MILMRSIQFFVLAFMLLLQQMLFQQQANAQCSGLTVGTPSVSNVACFGDNNGLINLSIQVDSQTCSSAGVALNEVMYRPTLANGLSPNAGEYIELIAPAGTNIGCYVLTDGDWAIVIPPNTIVPADGIFTIGNNIVYGAGFFDLDAENCNCFVDGAAGSGLLILTDGGEFLALYNSMGTFLQGIIYGTPTAANSPVGGTVISLPIVAGCSRTSVTLPAPSSFERPSSVTATGTSLIRSPDGTGAWTTQDSGSVNLCNAVVVNTFTTIWSNGATSQNISGLSAGTYTVTITHNSGCTVTQSATVTEPARLTVVVDSTRLSACSSNNGAAFVTAAGGTAARTFLWSNGRSTQNITGVGAGTYNVTVTDVRGCRATASTVVQSQSGLQATATGTNPTCFGFNNGSINIATTGGSANPTFLWNTGATTLSLANLFGGSYSLTIAETNGCVNTLQVQLVGPAALTLSFDNIQNVSCFGAVDGSINSAVAGGTLPYTYSWSNTTSNANASGLAAGNYTLLLSDFNGCTAGEAGAIIEPAALQVSLATIIDQLDCTLQPIGQVNSSTQGGTGTANVVWSDGNTESLRDDLGAGIYSITATDANGCTATTTSVTIFAPILPLINAVFDTVNTNSHTVLTNTPVRIRATNTPQTDVSYTWSVLSSNASSLSFSATNMPNATITPSRNGIYTILAQATSLDGCTVSDTLTLEVFDLYLGMPSAFTPNGDGQNDLFRPVQLDVQYLKTFQVFNRWGQLLYDNADLTGGGWDGTINGEAQARDVYIYLVTYQLPQAAEQQERGTFLLVR